MPEATETAGASASQPTGNTYLPWHLVPAFRPGETDINEFTKKLEFLSQIWPVEALPQLAPRVCLMCEGSAFQKVIRLSPEKLKVSSTEGCKLVVATLGGVWGRSQVELKFEKFEKAIFGTVQKADESNESYVARHEIHFEELQTMGITIEEMRAYILIRNSSLPTEDRKRIVVESKGNLVYQDVISTLKLLGSRFFNDVQGSSKNLGRKTYEANFADEDQSVMRRSLKCTSRSTSPRTSPRSRLLSGWLQRATKMPLWWASSKIWSSTAFKMTVRQQHAWMHTPKPDRSWSSKLSRGGFGEKEEKIVPKESQKDPKVATTTQPPVVHRWPNE